MLYCSIRKKKTGVFIKPKPIFVLVQDISEEKLIRSLHKYLGAGYVTINKINVSLYVTSLSELENILFPILDKHPLRYGKLTAYSCFKKIVKKMLKKEHLKLEGLLEIISASFQLNVDTARRTEESKKKLLKFLECKHGKLNMPIYKTVPSISNKELTLDFITGLIDGDGSFNVSFQVKPYRRVRVNFTVVQETSCKELLNKLKSYFDCGNVYSLPSAASRFQVENVDKILNNVKPNLDKVTFNTSRLLYYKIAVKVCDIIQKKGINLTKHLKK